VLGHKHRFDNITAESLYLQVKIASIIFYLFMINPLRNSNESVLVGILGRYNGSLGPADRLLMEVLNRIDAERSLNLLSSQETWIAFRNNWSRSNVESISSSLQSPFTLIDSDAMQRVILDFDVNAGIAEVDTGIDISMNSTEMQRLCATYDPSFWLPIIAYCLKTLAHSSELTLLIENSSIGYALVCLSAHQENIREMATHVLMNWERLCGVRDTL
jgi:hypothetical protein